MPTLVLEPTQSPIELLLGLYLGVKWLRCEVNHLRPSNAEVKKVWSYTSVSLVCLCGMDRQNIYLLPFSSLKERVCDTAHCRIVCVVVTICHILSLFHCVCGLAAQWATLTLNIPRGVLWGPPLVCYWLTSVEINKHKIFDTNNAWITEL